MKHSFESIFLENALSYRKPRQNFTVVYCKSNTAVQTTLHRRVLHIEESNDLETNNINIAYVLLWGATLQLLRNPTHEYVVTNTYAHTRQQV